MKKLAVWLLVTAAGPCSLHVGAEEASPAGHTAASTAAQPSSGLVPGPYYGPPPVYDPWALRHGPQSPYRHRPLPPRGPHHAVPPWHRDAMPAYGFPGPVPGPVPVQAPVRPAASAPTAPKKGPSTSASGALASAPAPEPTSKPEAADTLGFRPMGAKGSGTGAPAPSAVTAPVEVRHGEQGILINGAPPVFRPMGE